MYVPLLAQVETVAVFSREHLAALAAIAVAAVVCVVLVRRTAPTAAGAAVRRAVCWTLGAVLLAGAAASQVQQVLDGSWSVQQALPLHLCDIGLFVTAVAAFRAGRGMLSAGRGQKLYELAYYWGIGGTVQALLTPDVIGTFPAASCIRYFVNHGSLVVAVLVMTLGLRMRPGRWSLPRVWLTTLALAVVVMGINGLINRFVGPGANYMYLCGPPVNPTLYDLFGPWPWALLTLVGVGTLILSLCYAPFWIADRVRRARGTGD